MRVLHLSRDFPPRRTGGLSTAVGGMVAHLTATGIECAVISFDGWRPKRRGAGAPGREPALEEKSGAPVLRVSEPAHLEAARAFSADFGPGVVHVHDGMLWELGAELRERHQAAAVFTAHTAQRRQNRLREISGPTMSLAGQERALEEAELILAPSQAAAELLAEDHPRSAARLGVARLGIDDSPEARAAAERPRRPGGPITYVGRFSDLGGTGELFAAIPRILEAAPEARFVVAGGNPEGRRSEARWRRRFRDSVSAGVAERVRFPGWLGPGELAGLYAESAVLLSPSWLETFGLVLLEGMLFGVAIAATRSGGADELLEHDVTGLLSPPRRVEALVEHAVSLYRDPRRAARLGAEAARAARRDHLWTARIRETIDAYEKL